MSLILLRQSCLAQTKAPSLQVGDMAPPLNLTTVLQAPAGSVPTWKALRGKVVVLEFWATWCGPCLGAIPHLNALADEVKGKPIQFISITEPPTAHVETFLRTNPIQGWVGLDPTGAVSKSFGVHGIPQTFIVDPNGRVATVTSPEQLTKDILEAALRGEPLKLPSEADLRGVGGNPVSMQNVLVDVLIRANVPRDLGAKRYGQGAAGMSLKDMVATFYDVTPLRIVWPMPTPDLGMNFEYRIALPEGQSDQFSPFAQRILAAALGFKAHWETRKMNVLVLEGPTGKLGPTLTVARKRGAFNSSGPGTITASGIEADMIASAIETWSNKIVVNETKLHGIYDVSLHWNPGKPPSIFNAVQEQLGLELLPGNRAVRVLVVDHIDLPTGNPGAKVGVQMTPTRESAVNP